VSAVGGAWHWLTTGANWTGGDGVTHRLGEHLYFTGVSLGLALLLALPPAVVLGHYGRGGAVAVNVSNAGRAVPTFAVLTLLLVALGSGSDWPVIVALVLFAVPPLVTNAYVGMREADRDAVEAARAMGMTGGQLLLRVELPLAFPILWTGIRTAAVQVVATATLAAMAGFGGLGRIITAGFNRQITAQVVAGAVLVAVLALLVEGMFLGLQRLLDPMRRRHGRERGGRDRGRAPGRTPGRDPGRDPGRAPGRGQGRDPGRDRGRVRSRARSRGGSRERGRRRGRAARALAAAVLLGGTAGTGCGRSLEDSGRTAVPAGAKGGLVVGSAGFTESAVLAQLYAKVLAGAGYRPSVRTVQDRELYEPALEQGGIDVVPEYAATLADFLNTKAHGPQAAPVASPDLDTTMAALTRLAAPRGLRVLPAGKAVDQNAFAVRKDFAGRHHLVTLSDLGAAKLKITLAAGDECRDRPFCEPGLKSVYGIDISGIDPKGVGTAQSKQAVKDGTDQMALTTTTDATLGEYCLVLLTDDKHLQNADNVVPVVNVHRAGTPGVAAALARLTAVLTTADLTAMDRQVDAERRKPADVAGDYLEAKGLTQ
jgi:osmoprotectant transport system substrate-binding protein